MEFKDFQYLTHGDPVTFLLAWNMLLETAASRFGNTMYPIWPPASK